MSVEWLPELLKQSDFENDIAFYEAVYLAFKNDFIDNHPSYKGVKLGLKKFPLTEGKECTFFHMTTNGKYELTRTLDPARCERIKWPAPMIENDISPDLKIWEQKTNGEIRICIYCEKESYLVVLSKRKGYILPWTAYLVDYEHTKLKLLKQYERSLKQSI